MKNMLPCPAVKPADANLIAFDNDGTLYPAGEEVGLSVLQAHREFVRKTGLDMPTPDISWVRALIGADTKEFYNAMMPGQPREIIDAFEEFCLDIETDAVRQFPDLYPGARELLERLYSQGKTMVLISNGGPRYVKSVWDATGYGRFLVAAYPYGPPDYETKGERLASAISEYGGPAVMVGDRASDREAAEYTGSMFVGCRYGYGNSSELNGAGLIADSIEQLSAILLGEVPDEI